MKSTCVINNVFQFAVMRTMLGNCLGNRVRVLEGKNGKGKKTPNERLKHVLVLLDLSADNVQIHTGFIMFPHLIASKVNVTDALN